MSNKNTMKIMDLSERVQSYPLSRSAETAENTGYKYIHYGDIHTKVASIIKHDNKLPSIKKGNYKTLQKYDIVVADASEDYVGLCEPSIVLYNPNENLVAGLHTFALRPDLKKIDPIYLFYLLKSPRFKRYGYRMGTGMKVFGITLGNFFNFEFTYPNLDIQKRIGKLLIKLDEFIELQQLTIHNLREMKKGFLNKIYSRSNKKSIKTNFSDFEKRWSKTTLGSLSEIVRGASPRPISDPKWFDENSDIGWLRIADVTEQNGRIMHLKQKLSKEGREKTRVLYEPHLLLSIAASVGKPVINYIKTGVHDGFLIFKNPKFDINFMFYFFEYYEEQWKRYGQPGSQVNLNSTLVKEQKIYIPDYEEQVGIGNFFKQIDELIELEEQELESLQKMKKGFLQKVFV